MIAIYGDTMIVILHRIPFEPKSATIRKDFEPMLEAVAELVTKRVKGKVEIQGHADASEGAAGKRLARERAEAVRKALIELGVDSARLVAVGYGSQKPLAPSENGGHKINP